MSNPSRQRLEKFVEHVLHTNAQYAGIFGTSVPGMVGASAGSAASSNEQTVFHMHRDTLAFAKAISEGQTAEVIQRLAKEVEGGLMMSITLGALSEKDGGVLLDELHSLITNR
jgi:uncharacterized membrane protein YeaQ/YmgE (transglycosylase-associated protein family)